jgi:hypothetical protein
MDGSGVPRREFEKDAGEGESLRNVLTVAARVEARDFRRPCADEGRPGAVMLLLGVAVPSGGADGVQGLSAKAASNYNILSSYIRVIRILNVLLLYIRSQPSSGKYHRRSHLPCNLPDRRADMIS